MNGTIENIDVADKDLCITTQQDLGVLANVFFEPKTHVSDSLTYDITAWSLPYIYGLEAYATETILDIDIEDQTAMTQENFDLKENPYGYLAKWGTINLSLIHI